MWHLTLEQHGFKLGESTYTRFSFNSKYLHISNPEWQSVDVEGQCMHRPPPLDTGNCSICRSRSPWKVLEPTPEGTEGQLSGGEVQVLHRFSTVLGVSTPNP